MSGNNELMTYIEKSTIINYRKVNELINANDINKINKKNYTVLFIVLSNDDINDNDKLKLTKLFINHGADVDKGGNKKFNLTIFDAVFSANDQKTVYELLKLITGKQKTHIHNFDKFCSAVYNGFLPKTLKLFKNIVENMLGRMNKSKYTKLLNCYLSCQYNSECRLDIVKYLVENGANVNYQRIESTLQMLLWGDRNNGKINLLIVKYLLDEGINVNFINKRGLSILAELIKNKTIIGENLESNEKLFFKITKLLIDYGAKLNKKIKIPQSVKELFD